LIVAGTFIYFSRSFLGISDTIFFLIEVLLIGLIAMFILLALSFLKPVEILFREYKTNFDAMNAISAASTIIIAFCTIGFFYKQTNNEINAQNQLIKNQQFANAIQMQNEQVYLQDSLTEISLDQSQADFILNNMNEWKTTNDFIVGTFDYSSLNQITDDINLDQQTRGNVIDSIALMNLIDDNTQLLINTSVNRGVTLGKILSSTSQLKDLLKTISTELSK
jgi:primase-polymerase (primpol)-like protein